MNPHSNRKSLFQLIRHSFSRCCIAASLIFLAVPALNAYADIAWPPPEAVQQRVESAVELVDRLQTLVPRPQLGPVIHWDGGRAEVAMIEMDGPVIVGSIGLLLE